VDNWWSTDPARGGATHLTRRDVIFARV